MSWRDSAEEAVASLAAFDPAVLADRLTGEKLKVLAKAVVVSGSRPKLEVAQLIVERCDLITRMRLIGSDPQLVARTFKADSLKGYARELGCFTGLNKYGLACTVIGRRDQILRKVAHEMGVETPVPLAVRRSGAPGTDAAQEPARVLSADQGAA